MLMAGSLHCHLVHLTLARESFQRIYRYELDVKTKERMLLVLNVDIMV